MNEFLDAFRNAVASGQLIQIVLSRPVEFSESDVPERITGRPVVLKSGQQLQFAIRQGRQEVHQNLAHSDAVVAVEAWLRRQFRQATLSTTTEDITIKVQTNGRVRVRRTSASREQADPGHDRTKQYLIPEGQPCPFLEAIGVMNAQGKVAAAKYAKFRQINRALEFVNDLKADLPADGPLSVIDFGCGKSYLTFAIHHLLTNVWQREVNIIGLDLKADVIQDCSRIAAKLNCRGLRFEVGDIAGYQPDGPVDLSVSLHACDTASDMAIAQAVGWRATAILCVPCCHHQFATQIESAEFHGVLKHGILRERLAELLTDAARAAVLEQFGYRTQVMEFIELEHTPRNILIRAVRPARTSESNRERMPTDRIPLSTTVTAFQNPEPALHNSGHALQSLLRDMGIQRFALSELLQAHTSPERTDSPRPQHG